ncbi:MAG: glutamate mutase L [Capsulimonadaceae bacterium]|nr:glutamate mutase L [Capsulimonadaceae bacterium]
MTEITTILATDCGSTTTKAILIEKRDGEYRLTTRGEAPTTVEAPFDDVTVGVANAAREVEELSGRSILDENGKIITPTNAAGKGVDLYLSTSSAGGGLQMTVAGVVKAMSAESAERAALGAGAIIMDVIAVDDGRKDYQKIERIRALRPDMILMSGGTDGGTVTHLVDLAEMLRSADPKPRLGIGLKLPVIYAGNIEARSAVREILGDFVDMRETDNLRPAMDRENLGPAREAIHELFLEHVMQQAPGYAKLMTWTSDGIMSTPNAVGKIMVAIAEQRKIDVLGVDIGGATTDVFSVFGGTYNRTVSANLGMSYSICNVLTETGLPNIARWIPFQTDDASLRNQLRNKMIRPTTIPQALKDLQLEQAVAREALRLAFDHHKSLARGLKGVKQRRSVSDAVSQGDTGASLVDLMALDMIVGSGGVLSHAPLRGQSALMMMDAYQPEGITMLAVDSIFMMPQLGVLSTILPEAATQVFERDCLIKLGDCIAPAGTAKDGDPCVTVTTAAGETHTASFGQLKLVAMSPGETGKVTITPAKGFDVGAGKGKARSATVEGGVVGLIIDARGRPIALPAQAEARTAKLIEWLGALGLPA